MKLECTFNFFGQEHKCVREERVEDYGFGGEFNPLEKTISINKKYDKGTFLNYIHHELMEAAIYLNACSFVRLFPDKKEITMMDHSQLDVISGAICGAYEEIKSKMITKNDDEKAIKEKRDKLNRAKNKDK